MTPPRKKTRPASPLSREDWVKAASNLIAQEGVQAVAVEPLALALGVTKGSFYWHFQNRDELIHAALEAWEQDQSDDVVSRYAGIADPRRRLRVLLFAAFEDQENGKFFAALAVSSEDPRVQPYLRRATERRLAFGVEAFQALGLYFIFEGLYYLFGPEGYTACPRAYCDARLFRIFSLDDLFS